MCAGAARRESINLWTPACNFKSERQGKVDFEELHPGVGGRNPGSAQPETGNQKNNVGTIAGRKRGIGSDVYRMTLQELLVVC